MSEKTNQNIKNKNNGLDIPSLIYVISISIITLAVIVFAIIYITKPFDAKKLSHLDQITSAEVLTQKPTEYYVYLYNGENETDDMFEEISNKLISYENFVKDSKEKELPIFINKFEDSDEETVAKLFDKENLDDIDIPALIHIKDGKKQSTNYQTPATILQQLETLMK